MCLTGENAAHGTLKVTTARVVGGSEFRNIRFGSVFLGVFLLFSHPPSFPAVLFPAWAFWSVHYFDFDFWCYIGFFFGIGQTGNGIGGFTGFLITTYFSGKIDNIRIDRALHSFFYIIALVGFPVYVSQLTTIYWVVLVFLFELFIFLLEYISV